MRNSMRDVQRQRVYDSEKEYYSATARLETVPEIERFVRKVFASERVKKAFPRATTKWDTPTVHNGAWHRRAKGGINEIVMPKWARCEGIVLHELAHTITTRERGRVAAHGWQFCDTYLKLVLYLHGREKYEQLKRSMKEHRVKFRPPRKRREMTPEERAAATARLSVYWKQKKPKPEFVPPAAGSPGPQMLTDLLNGFGRR